MANIRDRLEGHVTLEVGCIDRLYLKGYVAQLERQITIVRFERGKRKEGRANRLGWRRPVPDEVVFIAVAQEKGQAFSGQRVRRRFAFSQDKTVYVHQYYFCTDDADFGPASDPATPAQSGCRNPPATVGSRVWPQGPDLPAGGCG